MPNSRKAEKKRERERGENQNGSPTEKGFIHMKDV